MGWEACLGDMVFEVEAIETVVGLHHLMGNTDEDGD